LRVPSINAAETADKDTIADEFNAPSDTRPLDTGEASEGPPDQPAARDGESLSDERPTDLRIARRALRQLKFAGTPSMQRLRAKIQNTLEEYYPRHQNTTEHCPWAIMHSIVAWGVDSQLHVKKPDGARVSAIGWLCFNGRSRNELLFSLSDGKIQPAEGPGLQGHQGQFLAMLAQSKVKQDYPMRIDGHDFTVNDLIELEKSTCYAGTELTFKLISLVHYLPHDTKWQNDRDEPWDLSRVLEEELAQPIRGAACGGTHRLMGYSYSVRTHTDRGHPLDGQWLRAKRFVEQYQKYALSLQNPDGSFSCSWFDGPGDWEDDQRKVQTTGHILEWLIYSLPEDRLADRRIVKSVDFVASILHRNRYIKIEVGPLGHALKALLLFEHRVFGKPIGQRRLRYADTDSAVPKTAQSEPAERS